MVNSEIRAKIFSQYEEKRQKAENERDNLVKEINIKFPRLNEIDKEINILGIENVKKISKEPQKSKQFIKELKEKYKELEKEKQQILKENSINKNYKTPKYDCKKCSDTGFLEDGSICNCYKQSLTNELYNISNLGDLLKKQNFNTFSFDYYSKEKTGNKKSPYENMRAVYDFAKNYCKKNKKERKNLLFYGGVGQGKTFVSSCIAKEIIEKGETVIYIRATKLLNMYEDYKFNRSNNKEMLDNIYNADLLIIDDLGTENITKIGVSFIFDVIDERILREGNTIINTNLSISDLSKTYTKRFTSRIAENFTVFEFYGEDIRLQKLK